MINDAYHSEAWEVLPGAKASAIYVNGLFKGMGFFACEEGVVLEIEKNVHLEAPVIVDGKPKLNEKGEMVLTKVTFAAKGILGRLLDASLYERGSALKPSMMQTLIYVVLAGLVAFMMGMSYAGH